MAKQTPQLSWCVVKMGADMNWWVSEVSDPVHWDTDGLSILDPRQLSHVIEMCEPLREYGFDLDLLEEAFFTFRVDKEVKDGQIRLVRLRDSVLSSEEKLFALPDILNEDKGPYAELLSDLTKARVKLLNDTLTLEQPLQVDDLEEILNERATADYSEGRNTHIFIELMGILEFVPEGFEDEIDEPRTGKTHSPIPDLPDVEEDEMEADETMKWGDEDEDDEDSDEEDDEDGDEDEDFEDEDEDKRPAKKSKPAPKKPVKPAPKKKKR